MALKTEQLKEAKAALKSMSTRREKTLTKADFIANLIRDIHAKMADGFPAPQPPTAREFLFHPTQEMTEEQDGSLTVRFTASGHLEMAWFLYMWGDAVELLAPEPLREMVEQHRRGDFPALP